MRQPWIACPKDPRTEGVKIPPVRGPCADFQSFMCIVLPPAGDFLPLLAESYPPETTKSRHIMTAEGYHHRDSLSFRDQSAGWSWESVPSLQVFFSFRRVLFFCRERPPAAHFSHQLEKWAKAHTVVSAGFQPRCGVKIGTLPRNHLASSATGGASAVSSQ